MKSYSIVRNIILAFVCLFSVLTSFTYAASLEEDINGIVAFINNKQYQEALDLAIEKLPEYEGEPSFDYVFGLAAQANKAYHQAVFSFERVVKNKPAWLKARYALAASYFASGNLVAAKKEFSLILQLDKQQKFPLIKDYLAKIKDKQSQSRGHWQHQIRLGFGHDDNANSGIEDELIDTPVFGAITVFESSQPVEDQFVLSQWQSIYRNPVNLNSRWYALASIRNSHYIDQSEMDRNYLDLLMGWQSRWQDINYQVNGFYRPIWLDGEHYLSYSGVQAEIDYKLKNKLLVGANLTLGQIDYQHSIQQNTDKFQWLAALWLEKSLANTISRLTFHAGEESSNKNSFDYLSRDYYGVQYRFSYLVTPRLKVTGVVDYGRSDYQADHPLFLTTREDTLQKVAFDVQYQYNKSWSGLIKLSYMDNESELALYEYDRTLAWFAVQYQF